MPGVQWWIGGGWGGQVFNGSLLAEWGDIIREISEWGTTHLSERHWVYQGGTMGLSCCVAQSASPWRAGWRAWFRMTPQGAESQGKQPLGRNDDKGAGKRAKGGAREALRL